MDKVSVVRHGDVTLHSVDSLPEGAKLKQESGNFTLALGEATAHTHKLLSGKTKLDSIDPAIEAMFAEGEFKVYETEDGVRYVSVTKPTALVHEEHRTIVVPQGLYMQMQEREEDPASEASANQRIRSVVD